MDRPQQRILCFAQHVRMQLEWEAGSAICSVLFELHRVLNNLQRAKGNSHYRETVSSDKVFGISFSLLSQ
jgi:hypothetical protein